MLIRQLAIALLRTKGPWLNEPICLSSHLDAKNSRSLQRCSSRVEVVNLFLRAPPWHASAFLLLHPLHRCCLTVRVH
jgi:hypothetical protein